MKDYVVSVRYLSMTDAPAAAGDTIEHDGKPHRVVMAEPARQAPKIKGLTPPWADRVQVVGLELLQH